jgi:integrase
MLDTGRRMAGDAGKGGRANRREGEQIARRRYQTGCLFIRGKRRKVWVARWREDVIRPDGSLGRTMRSEVLALVSELPKREAHKLLEARLRPVNQGRQCPQSIVSFEQFTREQWEPAVSPLLKRNSIVLYRKVLRKHLLPAFGHSRLCDIQRAELQRFFSEKLTQGFSPHHVHGMRTAMSKVLSTAVEWGHLDRNPLHGLRLGERINIREHVFLSPAQLQLLLPTLPEPCRTLASLAVLTGIRIGELLALRWKHVNFLRKAIRIRENVSGRYFGTPKTRQSKRTIPLSAPVVKVLAEHKQRCKQSTQDSLLFSGKSGMPLSADHLRRKVLQPACRKLGLPRIGWHSFRHTHATLFEQTGESRRAI